MSKIVIAVLCLFAVGSVGSQTQNPILAEYHGCVLSGGAYNLPRKGNVEEIYTCNEGRVALHGVIDGEGEMGRAK